MIGGCTSLASRDPTNQPLTGNATEAFAASRQDPNPGEDVLVGLAFSGGGTRGAAFAHGVLQEIDQTTVRTRTGTHSLLNNVGFVSGVSGGSVTAAYFVLKKREALADFRERFLLRNAEEGLSTSIDPVNLVRALGGGVNDVRVFARWLDQNLYNGATFADFRRTPGPRIWINASDIYNRTPFIYGEATFIALCSNLATYRIADAVASSAAVPIVFTPMVIKVYPKECTDQPPDWLRKAHTNPNAPPMLKAFADALYNYHDGASKYVKLLDGGLVDNYGLSGVTIALGLSGRATGPLKPREAVNMKRLLFIVVDSGRGPSGDWSQTVEGPAGKELVSAVVDAIIDANTRSSYAAFEASMKNWREDLVRWRCSLKPAEILELRGRGGPWNCRDLKFIISRVSFDQFGADRAKRLNAVPTSFTLPPDTIDELRQAGADALKSNPAFQAFLREAK